MAIKLTEIVHTNENLQEMKKWGLIAKRQAAKLLNSKGLENADYFVLRIKENSKLKDWIALYRSYSVLSGRPIFWINARLPEIVRKEDPDINVIRVIVDNILHEWWHAICDALRTARFRNVSTKTQVSSFPDQAEEDDAELFISFCGGNVWNNVNEKKAKYFQQAIKEFNNLWG